MRPITEHRHLLEAGSALAEGEEKLPAPQYGYCRKLSAFSVALLVVALTLAPLVAFLSGSSVARRCRAAFAVSVVRDEVQQLSSLLSNESALQHWEVTWAGSVDIHSEPCWDSEPIGRKWRCDIVRGTETDGWVKLTHGQGYLAVADGNDTPLLSKLAKGVNGTAGCNPCATDDENCIELQCCKSPGYTCYRKHGNTARCKAECIPGPDMTDEDGKPWTCEKLGLTTPGHARKPSLTTLPVPEWVRANCSDPGSDCSQTQCCSWDGMQCYEKNPRWASCKADCRGGPDMMDKDWTPWSCKPLGPRTPGQPFQIDWTKQKIPAWADNFCSRPGEDCQETKCCAWEGMQCYRKNEKWASCKVACLPGQPQLEDPGGGPWSCLRIGPRTPGNPQGVVTRLGSFLVIGDWGYDRTAHGPNLKGDTCQRAIAEEMAKKFDQLGDVKFVINVGDSFYLHGVSGKNDPQWDEKWRRIYNENVRSVPWYAVYGNHDYHHDPCACLSDETQCAQVNHNRQNREYFVMPGTNYFEEFPEFGVELIGLDLNHYMQGDVKNLNPDFHFFKECVFTPCVSKCLTLMRNRADASIRLLRERSEKSPAKNLLVFSHYPTDYFGSAPPELMGALRNNSKHDVFYFAGHRHNVDQSSTTSTAPNVNWLVGGGGGFGCDGGQQGFVVGEIAPDLSIKTYSVLVPRGVCCK